MKEEYRIFYIKGRKHLNEQVKKWTKLLRSKKKKVVLVDWNKDYKNRLWKDVYKLPLCIYMKNGKSTDRFYTAQCILDHLGIKIEELI